MPYARHYETFEVRKLLQFAEGNPSPVTSAPAHSRGLHAMQTPGGEGVSKADMDDRTHQRTGESKKQFEKRDGKPQTSAFTSLVQQAEAATQALNSVTGQAALAVLDQSTNAGLKIRIIMTVADIRETSFLGKGDQNHQNLANLPIGLFTSHKSDTTGTPQRHPPFKDKLRGVKLIVDCVPGIYSPNIFIQTCYPLDGTGASDWQALKWPPTKPATVLGQG